MKNSLIFRKAAEYIRVNGFHPGGGARADEGWRWENGGPVCAEGALLAICNIPSEAVCLAESLAPMHATIAIAARRVGGTVRERGRLLPCLWRWSDKTGRTAEEVIALFEACAEDEELKEELAAAGECGVTVSMRASKPLGVGSTPATPAIV